MIKDVKKFYRRDSLEKVMYGHVNALMKNLPFTLEKAILNFYKEYNITEDEWPFDAVRSTYYRIQKEWFQTLKTDEV